MTKLTKFILAIVFQVVIIFGIIIFKVSVLAGGTEILLHIEPVDPTSPLRGDYATFQYDISNLGLYLLEGLGVRNGDTVYVVLNQRGKYWTAESVQLTQPADSAQIFIKGKVAGGGAYSQSDIIPEFRSSGRSGIEVVYGVEEYFIPEGTGRNFNFGNKTAAAIVAVDENGAAALKRIIVDGKPWP